MGTHIENVLMQQSTGLKSNLPESRPVAELLVALNEFNKYELYTGTGNGVQPLFGDGTGSSNVSFELNQDNANTVSGKFVYFDSTSGTWKPAYAKVNTVANEHFTAQGFAVSANETDLQVTTSGKLIVPFRLKDYIGTPVVPGSYYYLCQEQSNAGMIQQAAPSSGIMQIVCQIIAADDNSTTMLLLNDLNQVAEDIIQTDGDGSKYLGDDGQYHNMQIAGLAGRTANCIDQYEILDISYNNISTGAGSYGYIPIGDIAVDENHVASNFADGNYILSKYMVNGETQYSFIVKQTFTSVENEPIWSAPNSTNCLSLENGSLKLVLNSLAFKGNKTYEPGTYWFKLNYNKDTGYVVSVSTDGVAYSNEIALFDEFNYLDKLTVYLGVIRVKDVATYTSGSIDLAQSGFNYRNNMEVTDNYPLSNLTDKNVSTITVTAKATGIIAAGRAKATGTLQAVSQAIDTVNNTIIAGDHDSLVWDNKNGLTTCNYEEIDYLRNYEGQDADTALYAKDTNYVYKYTIVYPNFLETGLIINKDERDVKANVAVTGAPTINNGVLSNFSLTNYASYPYKFKPGNKTWKRQVKFTTGAAGVAYQVLGSVRNTHCAVEFSVTAANIFRLWINKAPVTPIVSGTGTYTVLANTTYYVQIEFTGTAYILSYSTDGVAFTPDITLASEEFCTDNDVETTSFGIDASGKTFNGSIDLQGCYDEIDGERVWEGTVENTDKGDYKISFTNSNATFHPNTFLNRNGFNFNLRLDTTGKLQLDRVLSAANYGGTTLVYSGVQGCDWSTFINDGGYVQGIKLSSYLGTNNVGTGTNSLYTLTTNAATYWYMTSTVGNVPATAYFAFEKPIRFSYVAFRNAGSANYMPQQFAIHVSNDLTNWYNVLPETQTGFTKDGMFGNLPIDAYATWPSTTVNGYFNQLCVMPDNDTYYKYVRLCLYQSTNYQPEISGCWIGAFNTSGAIETMTQTARELIFEKEDFLNSGTSGINASVVRKKIGEAYQVKFLDKIGWTQVAPENALIDSTGKKLVPNEELIYHDPKQTFEIAQQTLAYQTHCKQHLWQDWQQGAPAAANPFNADTEFNSFGCANTGTVANSYQLLQHNTTAYDFNNGTNESAFIMSLQNRARLMTLVLGNSTAVYNAQQIRVYGSVDGGSVAGTVPTIDDGAQEAVWEEVPIIDVVSSILNDDPWLYSNDEALSYMQTAIGSNPAAIATTANATNAYTRIRLATKKAYIQYKIVVQRTAGNKVTLIEIFPYGLVLDPFATPTNADGENLPLLAERTYAASSTATVLPNKATAKSGIYVSPYSASTVSNLYYPGDNANWTPGNNSRYVYVQQAYKYPICCSAVYGNHANDLNYAANLIESYGTNYNDYATVALSNDNSLKNWTRLASLNEKCDIPTNLSVAQKAWSVSLSKQKYGYSYFTHLFARTLNNSVYMDGLTFVSNDRNSIRSQELKAGASYYTQEWKWTNVPGEAGATRKGACYNHPLMQLGDYESLTPSYAVKKRGDDYTYYTGLQGAENDYLPNGSRVFHDSSIITSMTLPFENRWMYKYVDLAGDSWYSPVKPNEPVEKQYMYKNIVPWFNKEFYTGIPLDATANEGSANGFTYFANVEAKASTTDGYAWQAFSAASNNATLGWTATNVYDANTGLPTGDTPHIGFISPKPITVNGYIISLTNNAKTTSLTGLAKWEFQASNDGVEWVTLDSRDTTKAENPDTPINVLAGTSYYFENEASYTHFRWVINQINTGTNFIRLACQGLFVLEEVPFEVRPIYELSYTNTNNEVQKAYTSTLGVTGEFIPNNMVIYKDIKFSDPLVNEWAYSVTYGENTFYTKVPGEPGGYVPESTVLYTDRDFINAFETPAKVDTWEYTGEINKKFAYTGTNITDFTWDGEEPYNKYVYTGEVANQYKYTGEIEGWQYTGVKEDIYDVVPNIKMTLNRDNARKIVKQEYVGPAYPVTNAENLSGTSYYSFTSGDIAGATVPSGTPLYSTVKDTTPVTTADGTTNYVFSSAPMQTRYNETFLYTAATDESEGSPVAEGTKVFQDADLTQEVTDIDVTQYTYTKDSEPSKMVDFYHRVTEPVGNISYNVSLGFDGKKYTFNAYADGASTDIQTLETTDLVKSSYEGKDESVKKHSVIIMRTQDILNLNLSKSECSWWEWNGVTSPLSTRKEVELFRLAKIDGVLNQIDSIYELYPWRVGDANSASQFYYNNDSKRISQLNKVIYTDDLRYNVGQYRQSRGAMILPTMRDCVSYVVESYFESSRNYRWYRLYSDGWLEQGGRCGGGAQTFLKPFANTNYMLQLTVLGTSDIDWMDRPAGFKTTGFTVYESKGTHCWYACGIAG